MCQKLLKIAGFGFRHNLSHTIHVLAGTSLHQPGSVLSSLIRNIMAVRLEMFSVVIHKRHKAPTDASKRHVGGCIKIAPFLSRMFSLALAS